VTRPQKYLIDPTYGLLHRHELPQLWRRRGHRFDMVDRDWTEYCHHCREPLALFEELRDNGYDLTDKATTVTERLASKSTPMQAVLFAWRVERPPEVQADIDRLSRQLLQLYKSAPGRLVSVRAQRLTPERGPIVSLEPNQWWEWVAATHADHHRRCDKARRNGENPVNVDRLQRVIDLHPLSGGQPRLEIFADMPLVPP